MKKYFTTKNIFLALVVILLAKLLFTSLDYGLCVIIGDRNSSQAEAEARCFRERFAL